MGSHRIVRVGPLFFISAVCLFVGSAFASALLGPNILSNEGFVEFASSEIPGSPSRSGRVDYNVYDPQTYTGSLATVPNNYYVYAYQVYNYGSSDLSIESFIVSLKYGVVGSIGYASGGGINPWITSPPGSESAAYFFYLNTIGVGDNSSVLWFSSQYGPTSGSATVNGASKYDAVDGIMVPVPEPVSFVLFGGGLFMLRFKRRLLKRS